MAKDQHGHAIERNTAHDADAIIAYLLPACLAMCRASIIEIAATPAAGYGHDSRCRREHIAAGFMLWRWRFQCGAWVMLTRWRISCGGGAAYFDVSPTYLFMLFRRRLE